MLQRGVLGLIVLTCTVVVGGELGGLGLPRLDVSLDLQHVALAEHLRTFYQLVADLSGAPTVDQSVLVLTKLGLERTNLQVHLTLIPRLVHLLSEQLLHSYCSSRVVVKAEDCGLLGRQRCSGDRGYVASRARVLLDDRRVVVREAGKLQLVRLSGLRQHRPF